MSPFLPTELALAFSVGFVGRTIIDVFYGRFARQRKEASFRISHVNEDALCNGPHIWTEMDSLLPNGEVGKITVCCTCGLLPTKNLMVPQTLLHKMLEAKRIREEENKDIDEFVLIEEKGIKDMFADEIKGGIDFKKLIWLHNAGQTMRERFMMYRVVKSSKKTADSNQEQMKDTNEYGN